MKLIFVSLLIFPSSFLFWACQAKEPHEQTRSNFNQNIQTEEKVNCFFTPNEPLGEPTFYQSCGTINDNGQLILEPHHLMNIYFDSNDLSCVSLQNGDIYYVNKNGKTRQTIVFDNGCDFFSEGLARTTIDGKFAYFDRNLEVTLKTDFDWGYSFREGRAQTCYGPLTKKHDGEYTMLTGGKCGFINKQGKKLTDFDTPNEQVTSNLLAPHIDKCTLARDELEELKNFEFSGISDKGDDDCLITISFKNEAQKNLYIQARQTKNLSPYQTEFTDKDGNKHLIEIQLELGEGCSCHHENDSPILKPIIETKEYHQVHQDDEYSYIDIKYPQIVNPEKNEKFARINELIKQKLVDEFNPQLRKGYRLVVKSNLGFISSQWMSLSYFIMDDEKNRPRTICSRNNSLNIDLNKTQIFTLNELFLDNPSQQKLSSLVLKKYIELIKTNYSLSDQQPCQHPEFSGEFYLNQKRDIIFIEFFSDHFGSVCEEEVMLNWEELKTYFNPQTSFYNFMESKESEHANHQTHHHH